MTEDILLQYREGNAADKDALKILGIRAYSPYADVLAPADWQTMHDYLHNEDKLAELMQQAYTIVCTCDGHIVGMAFVMPSGYPTVIYPADWSYIRMVGVDPDYQGHGIGRQLIHLCIEHARQQGEKVIGLHTSEFMDAARRIYERAGFEMVKEIGPLYGMRYWLYKMELE